jgi:hypothetical protein
MVSGIAMSWLSYEAKVGFILKPVAGEVVYILNQHNLLLHFSGALIVIEDNLARANAWELLNKLIFLYKFALPPARNQFWSDTRCIISP